MNCDMSWCRVVGPHERHDPYWQKPEQERIVHMQRAFVQAASRLPSIFDLDDAMVAVLALIDDAESSGEEPVDGLETRRQEIETALAAKTENYYGLIRHLEVMRDARKAEADRLRSRAATADRAVDWLKDRMKQHMEVTGQQRIEMPRGTFSLRQSPPRVEVLEEQMVPGQFKRTVITTTIDKRAILEYVKSGLVPDGVEIVRSTHVRLS